MYPGRANPKKCATPVKQSKPSLKPLNVLPKDIKVRSTDAKSSKAKEVAIISHSRLLQPEQILQKI